MELIDVENLKHRLNVLYLLDDAIISSEDDDWLHFVQYDDNKDYKQYTIDNGSGDILMVRFMEQEVMIRGFDHENDLNQFAADEWNEDFYVHIFAGIPDTFLKSLTESEHDETTFCMWYLYETGEWYQNEASENDGGKEYLLNYIPQSAETLQEWEEDYYDVTLNKEVVLKLFETAKLSESDKSGLIK